uniref:hypothetical protein n=1 Tax=Nonomuraea pusilla TaxID=46177 RepID=UPI00159C1EA2|nr:hypothetical protein [Nonomuraea pusilla]
MPYPVEPMPAVSGELPADRALYGLEVKWDGIRAVVPVEDGGVRVTGRHGADPLDGVPLFDLPYLDRRALLDELDIGAPPFFPGESDLRPRPSRAWRAWWPNGSTPLTAPVPDPPGGSR